MAFPITTLACVLAAVFVVRGQITCTNVDMAKLTASCGDVDYDLSSFQNTGGPYLYFTMDGPQKEFGYYLQLFGDGLPESLAACTWGQGWTKGNGGGVYPKTGAKPPCSSMGILEPGYETWTLHAAYTDDQYFEIKLVGGQQQREMLVNITCDRTKTRTPAVVAQGATDDGVYIFTTAMAAACYGNEPSSSTVVPSTSTSSPTSASTSVPSTNIPSTSTAPSTSVPSTSVPSTSVPSTSVPSTSVPSTSVPSTSVPSTSVPSTSVPSTSVPSTSVPSTSVPSTSVPSTSVPSTSTSTTLPIPSTSTDSPVPPSTSSTSSSSTSSSSSVEPPTSSKPQPAPTPGTDGRMHVIVEKQGVPCMLFNFESISVSYTDAENNVIEIPALDESSISVVAQDNSVCDEVSANLHLLVVSKGLDRTVKLDIFFEGDLVSEDDIVSWKTSAINLEYDGLLPTGAAIKIGQGFNYLNSSNSNEWFKSNTGYGFECDKVITTGESTVPGVSASFTNVQVQPFNVKGNDVAPKEGGKVQGCASSGMSTSEKLTIGLSVSISILVVIIIVAFLLYRRSKRGTYERLYG